MIEIRPGRHVGDFNPCYIISEISSNWKSFEDAVHSINAAKTAGADAVKFQLFDNFDLYGEKDICGWGKSPYLNPNWIEELASHAKAMQVDFLCTAFSVDGLELVNPHVHTHKVASSNVTHKRMLQALAKLGKPVIMSTGASSRTDIAWALEVLKPVPVIILYCVSAYPARSIHFEEMDEMRGLYHPIPIGFSDHSTDIITIPRLAVRTHHAAVLEKHMTAFEGLDTPDRGHSLTTHEFKTMVDACRGKEIQSPRAHQEEWDMFLRHNVRLMAIEDIQAGDTFKEGINFGIYRSRNPEQSGLHGFMIDEVVGKVATKAILKGTGIKPGDF